MLRLTAVCLFIAVGFIQIGNAARYAVIMGCNNGGNDVVPLKFAENDAGEFADILHTLGGFQPGNIHIVPAGDSAGLHRHLFFIDSLIRHDSDPNRLFLFYYSGHADANSLMLGNRRFSLHKLHGFFNSCAASVKIGIFDACYSGAVTTLKGGKQTQPFFFQEEQTIAGQVIIASSAATEAAQESQTLKGSIFSHHWFNALRGSADLSGSRQVTLNQAYQYAYRKTIETTALISGEIQHPVFKFDIRGQGDIVLTSLAKASSGLSFDRTCEGKFLVLSDDYIDVFADFSKKGGSDALIALRPGAYKIINAAGREINTHSFTLRRNEIYRMTASRLEPSPPSNSRMKGPVIDSMQQTGEEGTPLSTHGLGVGASGAVFFIKMDTASTFLPGLTFINSWYINSSVDLFLDFHWVFPGINSMCIFGFDYNLKRRMKPFYIGAGAGVYYLEKIGSELRDHIGASFITHAGYTFDLNKQMQLRVQVPYRLLVGTKIASSIGIELQLFFFGPYRDIKALPNK